MTQAPTTVSSDNGVHRTRLFAGICLALVPTGASFALLTNILGQLKAEFILTNAQVGYVAGAALWGMSLSLLIIGPALEGFGLKRGTLMAFVGHVLGLTLMIAAARMAPDGFWLLMLGAALLAMGNGMIEVAGNPLTAALYPEDKTTKLNLFHAFFPIGITIGAIVGFAMAESNMFIAHWTWQLAVIYIPVFIYGIMVLPQKFPKTETAEAGIPASEMFKYTLTHPLFLAFLVLKAITVSMELAPMRWVQEFLVQLGIHGILVLAWISFIMVVLRLFASHFVERLAPTGMLLGGALLTFISLFLMSFVNTTIAAFAVATIFGVGIAFFFPTMLGIVSERMPRTGSLGIVLTAGVGLFAAGAIGTPMMGAIADHQSGEYLNREAIVLNQNNANGDEVEMRGITLALLETVRDTYPQYIATAEPIAEERQFEELGFVTSDLKAAIATARDALQDYAEAQRIRGSGPVALRTIRDAARDPLERNLGDEAAGITTAAEARAFAAASPAHAAALAARLIPRAEAEGFQASFLWVSPLALIVAAFFAFMYISDKRKGGYQIEKLVPTETTPDTTQ